jgi:hypothetical protein
MRRDASPIVLLAAAELFGADAKTEIGLHFHEPSREAWWSSITN